MPLYWKERKVSLISLNHHRAEKKGVWGRAGGRLAPVGAWLRRGAVGGSPPRAAPAASTIPLPAEKSQRRKQKPPAATGWSLLSVCQSVCRGGSRPAVPRSCGKGGGGKTDTSPTTGQGKRQSMEHCEVRLGRALLTREKRQQDPVGDWGS